MDTGTASFNTPGSATSVLGPLVVGQAEVSAVQLPAPIIFSGLAATGTASYQQLSPTSSGAMVLGPAIGAGAGSFLSPVSGHIILGNTGVAGLARFSSTITGSVALAALISMGQAQMGMLGLTATGTMVLGPIAFLGPASLSTSAIGSVSLGTEQVFAVGSVSDLASSSSTGTIALGPITSLGAGSLGTLASGSATSRTDCIQSGTSSLRCILVIDGRDFSRTDELHGFGLVRSPASGPITLANVAMAGIASFQMSATGSVALAAQFVSGQALATPPASSTATGTVLLGAMTSLAAGAFGASAKGSITLGSIIFVSGFPPFYLPYEYLSVLMTTGNVNPFDIDPERTTLIMASNVNPFDIDPEQTTLITSGLTRSD